MSPATPVGVNDDFSTRQAGVRIRTARVNKSTGGVHKHRRVVGHQGVGKHRFDDVVQHLLPNPRLFGFLGTEFFDHVSMLNGDHNVVHVGRLTVASVHQRHL